VSGTPKFWNVKYWNWTTETTALKVHVCPFFRCMYLIRCNTGSNKKLGRKI
jgi:hypothetical protein